MTAIGFGFPRRLNRLYAQATNQFLALLQDIIESSSAFGILGLLTLCLGLFPWTSAHKLYLIPFCYNLEFQFRRRSFRDKNGIYVRQEQVAGSEE